MRGKTNLSVPRQELKGAGFSWEHLGPFSVLCVLVRTLTGTTW